MYHALWAPQRSLDELKQTWAEDSQLKDPGARLYALDQELFDRHMRSLTDAGVALPTSWAALKPPPNSGAVWITFDDGHQSNIELALPVLLKYGLKAIFFITTDWIGHDVFMDEEQIKRLHQAGMLIGSHGCSHRFFSEMDETDARRELTESKSRLEAILQKPVLGISLPGGRTHPKIRQLAREAGYQHLFNSTLELANPNGDPLNWPRIALTNRLPVDFVERLVQGDTTAVDRLARRARLIQMAQRLLGENLYQRLRQMAVTLRP